MLIYRASEIKEGLFGEEEFSLTPDGKIENYTFQQFGDPTSKPLYTPKQSKVKQLENAQEQPKTPLQESVEEIQDWQQENEWKEKEITTNCKHNWHRENKRPASKEQGSKSFGGLDYFVIALSTLTIIFIISIPFWA